MPRIVGKGGKVEHLPYTQEGMARAAAAKKRGVQVGYGQPPKTKKAPTVRTRTRKEPR